MNEVLARLTEAPGYLLAWEGVAVVHTSAGPRESRCRLEAVVDVQGDHPLARGISIARLGIAAGSVDARGASTGTISVVGRSGRGIAEIGEQTVSLRLEVESELNYESLDRARGIKTDVTCYYVPAMEPAVVVIEGELLTEKRELAFARGSVRMAAAAGELEEIHALEIELEYARLEPIDSPRAVYRLGDRGEWAPLDDANTDANVCVQVNRRRLVVQPVGFRSSATDPTPSGGTAAAQVATAQSVWGKSCIEFQVAATHLITDATLKTSSDLAAIRAAYTDADPGVIEVFFVENSLPGVGGGSAGAIGVASCKPVIAEPNSGNPVLLAHELGHVLGLFHPGAGSNSDAGTVMAPTGSAMVAGTTFVTHFMCVNIGNPVLQTLATPCCLTHDIGNHYVRDFPVDVGTEPSEPLPAGMTRYSMSNVWNRLTNTAGGWSATTGPEHQHPVRFNPDMTPRTNYLFAKVEQTVNLKVRSAVVRFFRKNPGSGGGAANLLLLGQVPVPDTLAVGVPQTVSLPWTIPTGTPAHSCIFAVVRSDAEQDGDQSSLDWWQFEALSRLDNDWAQRNLDIQDFASGNVGDSNSVESAPALIYLPPRQDRKGADLILDVDATGAKGADALTLEVIGEEPHKVNVGAQTKINVPLARRREPLVVLIAATIPGGLERGRTIAVEITPSIGDRSMIGFASTFRSARERDAVAQTLDVAASAFLDLGELVDFDAADKLVCWGKKQGACPPYSFVGLVNGIGELKKALAAAKPDLEKIQPVRRTGAVDALKNCLRTIEAWEGKRASAREVAQALRRLCNRLSVAAAIASQPR
jgi:hypothetical protein